MKVLHLSGATIWGGNEQQLADLAENLRKNNVESHVFCFTGTPIEQYALKHNFIVHSNVKEGSFSFNIAKKLASCVSDNDIDIIHIHTSNYVTTFMLAGEFYKLKIPTVFSKKGISDSSTFLSSIKYNYKGIKKVVCVSKAVEDAFRNVLKPKNHHKLITVYDGIRLDKEEVDPVVDLRKKYNIPTDTILVGNIANHAPAKDIKTFIETINYTLNTLKARDLHFIQIGKKLKYSEDLIPLAKEYNLENYLTFTDFIPEAYRLMNQFDVLVITSKKEGGPSTLLDAFKSKIPVVSTSVGMIPEFIVNGRNGFVCEVGDYEELGKNLIKLVHDRELGRKFVDFNYNLLREYFDYRIIARKMIQVYKSVLK